jgi:hypothetical protein
MDPEEQRYQINLVITQVLELGKEYHLKSDGKSTKIIVHTHTSKDKNPNHLFTTTL